jgi:hypothetical protein
LLLRQLLRSCACLRGHAPLLRSDFGQNHKHNSHKADRSLAMQAHSIRFGSSDDAGKGEHVYIEQNTIGYMDGCARSIRRHTSHWRTREGARLRAGHTSSDTSSLTSERKTSSQVFLQLHRVGGANKKTKNASEVVCSESACQHACVVLRRVIRRSQSSISSASSSSSAAAAAALPRGLRLAPPPTLGSLPIRTQRHSK